MRAQTVLLALTLGVASSSPANAQVEDPPEVFLPEEAGEQERAEPPLSADELAGSPKRFQGGVGFILGVPTGGFATNIGAASGVTWTFGVGLGDSPVSIAVEGAYLWYGLDQRPIPLGIPEVPDAAEFTVHTDNAMLLLQGRLRAQTRSGRWRPYVDGLFGFTDIFTRSHVQGVVNGCSWWDTCIAPRYGSHTHVRDIVPSRGFGAGVMLVRPSKTAWGGLDLSVRYLSSGTADYLRKGAIAIVDDQTVLDMSRSRTDMVLVTVGVAFGQ